MFAICLQFFGYSHELRVPYLTILEALSDENSTYLRRADIFIKIKLTFQCCLEYLFRKFSNKKQERRKSQETILNKAGLVSSDNIYRAVDAHISRLEYIYIHSRLWEQQAMWIGGPNQVPRYIVGSRRLKSYENSNSHIEKSIILNCKWIARGRARRIGKTYLHCMKF
jgi:hypothetical protein